MEGTPVKKAEFEQLREASRELRNRLLAGHDVRVEDLITFYPSLAGSPEAMLELVRTELTTRHALGQNPSLKEWQARFPDLLPRLEPLEPSGTDLENELPTLSESSTQRSVGANGLRQDREGRPPRIGNYQVLEEIGRGGMGVVYKAKQLTLSRIVAIKMILAGEHAGYRERARLRIEAEAASQLVHPNVVQIFEIGEHEGLPFLAMEYVGGGNLTRMLKGMPQAYRWSARLAETLARAIHVAHKRGIVHRDLNPTNILMAPDGTPKISDFGLAKFLMGDPGVSQNGVLLGTPAYMAPEQVSDNGKKVGPATDVYALGILIYQMITGGPPFRGLTPMEMLCQVVEGEVVPPSRLRHGVPADLETICLKCLERDPAQRYPTAQALADDLRRFQEQEPILAKPTPRIRRAMQWVRREPRIAALLGLSASLLTTLLVVILGYSIILKRANVQLEAENHKSSLQRSAIEVQKEKAARELLVTRRRQYGAQLNLIKQIEQSGQNDLAQELFARLETTLERGGPKGFEWDYLDRLTNRFPSLMLEQNALVTSLAISRDGNTLAVGDLEGNLTIWDLSDRDQPTSLVLPNREYEQILKVAVSSNARGQAAIFAIARSSNQADVTVDLRGPDGRLIQSLDTTAGAITRIQFSPSGSLLTLCGPATAQLGGGVSWTWQLAEGQWQVSLNGVRPGILLQELSPDGQFLALACLDGTLRLQNLGTGQQRDLEDQVDGKILCFAFSPDGRRVAVGKSDGSLSIWDVFSGSVVARYHDQFDPVYSLWFCLNGKAIVVREGSQRITMRQPVESGSRRVLPGIEHRLYWSELSPNGTLLAAAGRMQPLTVWDLETGKRMETYRGQTKSLRKGTFSADGKALIVLSDDLTIRIWQLNERPDPRQALDGHRAEAWCLSFSPDGRILATGADDHTIKLWDVETGRELATLKGHTQTVTALTFLPPSSNRIASVSLDGTARLWTLHQNGLRSGGYQASSIEIARSNERLYSMASSPDARQLAWGGASGKISLWDVPSARHTQTIEAHRSTVHALAYSPKNGYFASASNDKMVYIWNSTTAERASPYPFHNVIDAVAYSHDGELLATGGVQRVVNIMRTNTSEGQSTLPGHADRVRAIAFSPDGQVVATGCDDGLVRLWDPITGQFFYSLEGHSTRVNAVAFSPDGQTLASCDHDGAVLLWRAGRSVPRKVPPR